MIVFGFVAEESVIRIIPGRYWTGSAFGYLFCWLFHDLCQIFRSVQADA